MDDETPFRIAVATTMFVTMAITAYHRWQAARSGEPISRREEGWPLAIVLRLAGVGLWVVTFLYLVAPATVSSGALPLPVWVRWCGVIGGSGAAPLMYWTLDSLGRNLTDTVVTRAQATLVTHGPYRWVRHPFYVVAGLLMLSVSLLSANAWIAACSVAVLALLALRTPKEERKLIERFGDDYRRYMTQTGRYFPRLW